MSRKAKKTSMAAGLAPGTLVHVGEKKVETVSIQAIDYDEENLVERDGLRPEDCFEFREKATTTWINVCGLHDLTVIEKLGDHFGLHPLVMEDVVNTAQRPKAEDYDQYLYVVVRMLTYDEQAGEVVSEQVSLVLGPGFVISFQEREGDVFDPLRERIRSSKGRVRRMGPDFLVYALLDSVIDGYFSVLETLGERVDDLQDEVTDDPTPRTQNRIHRLKREMIALRRSVWPLREAAAFLERGESGLITQPTTVYLRDAYDHTIQVIDTIETLRDMISGMLDTYLASISNRMNEVMKVLTIMASVFIPLTFVAGIYGMNFDHMPELHWRWGYAAVWLVMIALVVSMLIYFRKKQWV